MTSGSEAADALALAFEERRGRLVSVAYRMLGSRADAEDAVQEAWLRLARQEAGTVEGIDNLSGWLTTVVGRICLDTLRARRARPEEPFEERLPECVEVQDGDGAPVEESLLAESVGVALLMVLDALSPAERLAFVLHDTFGVPFAEVGRVLGRSPEATKMLASRARRKVRAAEPGNGTGRERAVVEAFLAAAREGDFDGLLRLLAPEVSWRGHGAHDQTVRLGRTEVAARVGRGARAARALRLARVDGGWGIVAYGARGRAMGVLTCAVSDGTIVAVHTLGDPRRVAALAIPPLEAADGRAARDGSVTEAEPSRRPLGPGGGSAPR
ncbi:RNA polymerase sigma-70 factor, ECF subfamily [Streptomyces zhaozhouensis]|uniref:RNA polymerase sigma-70 factor, ECF subfamily n=1 Tax=Streptomyces zhaozhouensis TaxID=1300267 RepID=A0A286DSM1_9ACTN|nr:sigma-70 family RNA polymerase sigma factor [Streptomyces zhaozhouensis]SOD61635.1 RNA polymerase sigma-70 factor, ECF subfamily [Streptomyces zhaozhouensis]